MSYFPSGFFPGLGGSSGGGTGSGLTPEESALLSQIATNVGLVRTDVGVIRTRQNERVPEPTPLFEVPAASDPAKAVVYVRTADFLGKPLKNARIVITLKDERLLVIGGKIRTSRQVIGRTNEQGEVAMETWHTNTIEEAGLEPDYEVDIPGVPNFTIRVPPLGGLASDLKYLQ